MKRAIICTLRMGRIDTTVPNVGELTTVSMEPHWGMFNTLFAWMRSDRLRLPRYRMLFDIDMLNVVFEGPVIRLRAELPNVPATGTEKAAVLKNISIVGFDRSMACPL